MSELRIKLAVVMLDVYNGISVEGKSYMPIEKANATFNELLVSGSFQRSLMCNAYDMFVKDEAIIPIGDLPEADKLLLREKTKKILNGRSVQPEHLMEIYKSLHTIELLNKQ